MCPDFKAILFPTIRDIVTWDPLSLPASRAGSQSDDGEDLADGTCGWKER